MAQQKTNKIYLLTHGGLGNQLFQIFYAICKSKGNLNQIALYHSANYYHGIELNNAFRTLQKTSEKKPLLFKTRLIKLLTKVKLLRSEQIKLLNNVYLDGYFQNPKFWLEFDTERLNLAKDILRDLLQLKELQTTKETLLHLRLGDFFKKNKTKRKFIKATLKSTLNYDKIITNDENLTKEILNEIGLDTSKIVSTNNIEPQELIKIMCSFEKIISNGSTLATWASILSDNSLSSTKTQEEIKKALCQKL